MKTSQYEKLMSWTIRNIDKKLYNLHDLSYSIQEIDIHHVINDNEDFISFINDLSKRTGINIIPSKKSNNNSIKKNIVKGFFENHYINFNEWELNFMRSIKSISNYSEKQKDCILKIMNKIDKSYAEKFLNN